MNTKLNIYIPFTLIFLVSFACKQDEAPIPEVTKTFMLAIINPPSEVPFDFEADEAVGDFKESTGLLRIQGTSIFNRQDKIELTIKQVNDGIIGTYSIGNFNESATNVKAEFIDGFGKWNARSTSGKLEITKFEQTEIENAYFLSATFSFKAASANGEVIVESGEIENAVILL